MVRVRRRRQDPQPLAKNRIADETIEESAQAGMCDLRGEELEEAVELLDVAPGLGNEACRVGLCVLERAHLELEPVAKALDTAQDSHRVALAEALIEKVDVVPHARVDPAARVDELEREI